MNHLVSFGEFNIYLTYIFLAITFNILNSCFYGLNNNEVFKTIKFFTYSKLSIHLLIRYMFNYILIFIISLCYYLYFNLKSKKKQTSLILTKTTSKIELIHYDPEDNIITKKIIIINILIQFSWYIEELCFVYFKVLLKDIDFWMIELLFLALLNLKIFNLKIYKHQWLAIYISLFSSVSKVLSIVLTIFDYKYRKYEEGLPILYRINRYYFFGFFLYLLFIFLRASSTSGIKWLMEKKFKPSNQILMEHGIIGIFCTLICITFSSYFSCNKFEITIERKNNFNNYTLSNYLCKVKINESNYTYEYLDNIFDYFKKEHWKSNYKDEILTIIFGSLTFFFSKYFNLVIIKNLSPAHFTFSFPISFFFQKLLNIIVEIITKGYDFIKKDKIKTLKFLLDMIGDEIAIFGFLIFLEIIILNCKKFDYNIKENIIKRSVQETSTILDESLSMNLTGNESINGNKEV